MSCFESTLTFNQYQNGSRVFASYPDLGKNFTYPALGLAGEAGEVCDKIKKVLRDKGGVVNDDTRAAIRLELGDVCWYIAQLCTELGLSLADVAQGNLDKLQSRLERNKINGDGDNR